MNQFDKDMESAHCQLFQEAREFLLSIDGIVETQKHRITTYSDPNGGICHLRTMPHGIDIGFLKGAKMQDALHLLSGNGKAIRILSISQVDTSVLSYYLDQAVVLNR